MVDNKFPSGLIIKAPRQGAPDFIKGSISIKKADLIAWLELQEGDWVNADIKESKGGKWYAQVNTWKPETKKTHDDTTERMNQLYADMTKKMPENELVDLEGLNQIPF